jgi:sucrose-phosphate synthase
MTAPQPSRDDGAPPYIALISIHGLIRGERLELGRDADTGGQTRYVVELARALAERDDVERVELLTRRVVCDGVDADYAREHEPLGPRAAIVRLDAGPEGYIAKEQLWDHLDAFVDNALAYLRAQPRLPDLLHSHYADAGYVGSRLSHLLDIPLIHTGHSLGRVKRRRLLANGLTAADIEATYTMARRIEAEETTLASAERVITSTRQEIAEQYELYDFYQPERMQVVPPGTDLSCFHAPDGGERATPAAAAIAPFLRHPDKPMILVLARPDPRKNLPAHVEAFGRDARLREVANLVIVAGGRDAIEELDPAAQEVLTEILLLVDRYDLYGSVAYPKRIDGADIPALYRLAAATGGVHVNAALTEPFGLTFIEAAASGLPIVAPSDGGPRDIIANCGNGVVVDSLDVDAIAAGIRDVLLDRERWQQRVDNGLKGVREHYSWSAHARRYLEVAREVIAKRAGPVTPARTAPRRALYVDRAIFTDIDQNLLGAPERLPQLARVLREHRREAAFGIATGRRLDAALSALRKLDLPEPDILISGGGTRIHYAPSLAEDHAWTRHIDRQWTPHAVRRVLDALPGLEPQPRDRQSRFKISYFIDPGVAPSVEEINALLYREDLSVNVIASFGQFLDVLPIRASKGLALRHATMHWGIPTERVLAAGGSGADEDMMRGNTLAVVVSNRHGEELSQLTDVERVYYANGRGAAGILEALEHYDFFGACCAPGDETRPV